MAPKRPAGMGAGEPDQAAAEPALPGRQRRPLEGVTHRRCGAGVGVQCLKWRTPEYTITTPRSSAASITS